MKTLYLSSLLMIMGFGPMLGLAQKEKMDGSLNQFLNSGFVTKFRDIRIEAEGNVKTFKQQMHQYKPEDAKKVQIGYDQTAIRFNQLLTNIKMDFLNTKKLKYITEFPDSYVNGLQLELNQLQEFYTQNFLQPLADAQGQQVDGAILLVIAELVGLTKGIVDYFSQIKREKRQYNETYLQQHLYMAHRFRLWNELTDFETMADPALNPIPAPDPSLIAFPNMQAPALEQTIQRKSDDTNPYNNAETYDQWIQQQQAQPSANQQPAPSPAVQPPAQETNNKPNTGKAKTGAPVTKKASTQTKDNQ